MYQTSDDNFNDEKEQNGKEKRSHLKELNYL